MDRYSHRRCSSERARQPALRLFRSFRASTLIHLSTTQGGATWLSRHVALPFSMRGKWNFLGNAGISLGTGSARQRPTLAATLPVYDISPNELPPILAALVNASSGLRASANPNLFPGMYRVSATRPSNWLHGGSCRRLCRGPSILGWTLPF